MTQQGQPLFADSMKDQLMARMEYNEEKYAMIVTYVTVTQFIICWFNSLERVDPFAAIVVIAFYALNEKDKRALAAFLGFQVFSILLDIVWLALHADTESIAVTPDEVGSLEFVIAMTIISLILKVVVVYPAMMLIKEFPLVKPADDVEDKPKTPRIARWIVLISIVQIGLAFFNSLARSDLYHCAILLVLYAIHELDYRALIPYGVFTFFSVISDICWISLHSDDVAVGNNGALVGATHFVVFTSVMGLIVKIMATVFVGLLFKQLKDAYPTKPSEIGLEPLHIPSRNIMGMMLVFQTMICFLSDISPFRKDLYVIVILMMIYAINEKDRKAVLAYVFFTFLTWVFDITWLAKYPISDSTAISSLVGETASAFQFVWVFTLFGILAKVGAVILAYQIFTELPETKPEEGQESSDYRKRMKKYMEYNEEKFSFIVRNIAIAQLTLCFFNCLYRADPFAVVVIVAFYAVHEKDKRALLGYIFFMLFSFLLDIVWLAQHTYDSPEGLAGTAHFVVFCTIVGILLKAFILYPVGKLYSALPEIKPSDRAPHIDPEELKQAFGEVVKDVLTKQINELEGQMGTEPARAGEVVVDTPPSGGEFAKV